MIRAKALTLCVVIIVPDAHPDDLLKIQLEYLSSKKADILLLIIFSCCLKFPLNNYVSDLA